LLCRTRLTANVTEAGKTTTEVYFPVEVLSVIGMQNLQHTNHIVSRVLVICKLSKLNFAFHKM
jgi:hypothetical protein